MLWPMVIKCEGHKPSCSLSCLVGWEQIYSWWTAVSHKQPLLHVWITYNCFFFPFKCLVVQTNLIWSGLFGTDMQDVPALFQLVRCSEFFYLIKWILVSMLSSELIGLGAHCYLACHSNWTCSWFTALWPANLPNYFRAWVDISKPWVSINYYLSGMGSGLFLAYHL